MILLLSLLKTLIIINHNISKSEATNLLKKFVLEDTCKTKSVKTSIGTDMRNPEMLKFVSDHLKTKKICKDAVKKLPSPLRYVPD